MKSRLLALVPTLLLLGAAPPPPQVDPRPDLTILQVSAINMDAGTLRVWVRNQGKAPAPAAVIRVLLTGPVYHAKNYPQPAIKAGETVTLSLATGTSLVQAAYGMRTDGLGAVTESNENNNTIQGQFEGKP